MDLRKILDALKYQLREVDVAIENIEAILARQHAEWEKRQKSESEKPAVKRFAA